MQISSICADEKICELWFIRQVAFWVLVLWATTGPYITCLKQLL